VDLRYHATSITPAFERACCTSSVSHATFHNCRHTFVTNARRAGIDAVRFMVTTGHTTMAVFSWGNTIDPRDLPRAIYHLETYLDTMDVGAPKAAAQNLGNAGMGR
jgi:hypothetical protein